MAAVRRVNILKYFKYAVFAAFAVYSLIMLVLNIKYSDFYMRGFFSDVHDAGMHCMKIPNLPDLSRFYGFNTTIGVMLLFGTAATFAIAYLCARRMHLRFSERMFYFVEILFFFYLACDDRFLFHETYEEMSGIKDVFIFAFLGIFQLSLLFCLKKIRRDSWKMNIYLLLAGGFFGLMVLIDFLSIGRASDALAKIPCPECITYLTRGRLALEDLFKLWSAFFLFLYGWYSAMAKISELAKKGDPDTTPAPGRTGLELKIIKYGLITCLVMLSFEVLAVDCVIGRDLIAGYIAPIAANINYKMLYPEFYGLSLSLSTMMLVATAVLLAITDICARLRHAKPKLQWFYAEEALVFLALAFCLRFNIFNLWSEGEAAWLVILIIFSVSKIWMMGEKPSDYQRYLVAAKLLLIAILLGQVFIYDWFVVLPATRLAKVWLSIVFMFYAWYTCRQEVYRLGHQGASLD